ncbi:hypothetical protein DRO59_09330 [Candidatus Bathyarchaeota archaeon]|nr:MAG: hypothetical protein DRO59_09330 [Candidatus Bathyarchaeota archaeon]
MLLISNFGREFAHGFGKLLEGRKERFQNKIAAEPVLGFHLPLKLKVDLLQYKNFSKENRF